MNNQPGIPPSLLQLLRKEQDYLHNAEKQRNLVEELHEEMDRLGEADVMEKALASLSLSNRGRKRDKLEARIDQEEDNYNRIVDKYEHLQEDIHKALSVHLPVNSQEYANIIEAEFSLKEIEAELKKMDESFKRLDKHVGLALVNMAASYNKEVGSFSRESIDYHKDAVYYAERMDKATLPLMNLLEKFRHFCHNSELNYLKWPMPEPRNFAEHISKTPDVLSGKAQIRISHFMKNWDMGFQQDLRKQYEVLKKTREVFANRKESIEERYWENLHAQYASNAPEDEVKARTA